MEIGTVASTFSAASVSTPRSAYRCFARSYAACNCLSLMSAFQTQKPKTGETGETGETLYVREERDLCARSLKDNDSSFSCFSCSKQHQKSNRSMLAFVNMTGAPRMISLPRI